jgi:hypothetical protein
MGSFSLQLCACFRKLLCEWGALAENRAFPVDDIDGDDKNERDTDYSLLEKIRVKTEREMTCKE